MVGSRITGGGGGGGVNGRERNYREGRGQGVELHGGLRVGSGITGRVEGRKQNYRKGRG